MNFNTPDRTADESLARTAFGLVVSSMIFPFVAALAVVFASNPARFMADSPSAALFIATAAAAYATSLLSLYRLRGLDEGRRTRLWFVSLVATLVVIVAFIAAFGALVGSIVGVGEIVAAAVHLRAIVLLS